MRWPRLIVFLCVSLLSAAVLSAQTSSSSAKSKPAHITIDPTLGEIADGVYRNSTFAFSYKIPFGWVERTQDMQGDDSSASKSRLLLAIFERPPDAPGTTVNSAVVIAAEKASDYPGLKTAADYFGPMEELIAAKGFKVVSGPDEFPVGVKKLARGDFAKEMPGASNDKDKLTMQQSTVVELEHGYVVSFTFIAGDEDEVEDLIGNLSFVGNKSAK